MLLKPSIKFGDMDFSLGGILCSVWHLHKSNTGSAISFAFNIVELI